MTKADPKGAPVVYFGYTVFGILMAVATALFVLAACQRRRKGIIELSLAGFAFMAISGMFYPH